MEDVLSDIDKLYRKVLNELKGKQAIYNELVQNIINLMNQEFSSTDDMRREVLEVLIASLHKD